MARIVFEGEPATLVNWWANAPGSIHDDERARELGFRGEFAPGPTVALLVEETIVEVFGKAWFEGGWYDMKFVSPAYVDEPVHVVLSENGGPGYAFEVLAPDGRLACVGCVGLGTEPPWDASADGARAGRAFPACVIGEQLGSFEFTPQRSDVDRNLSPGVSAAWFTGPSPFGGPLAPSGALLQVLRHGQPRVAGEGLDPAGMIGRMQMVVERPMLLDRPYRAELEVADKGESRRTWFRTVGYRLFDKSGCCGFGRLTTKWWAPKADA